MKRIFLLVLTSAFAVAAAEKTVELDPAQTTIAFTVDSVLHTVHGSFQLKRGSVKFDSASGKAAGEIVVDVTSGESGNSSRDKRMQKEILESARFPEAVFTPDRVSGELAPAGPSELDLHGVFQIHGASHEVTLHFHAEVKGGGVAASTSLTIPYVQWGMKNPSTFLLKVSDKVDMRIQATGRVQ